MSYEVYIEHQDDFRMRNLALLTRWFYPKANGLMANSRDVLEDLIHKISVRLERHRTKVISNPIDIEKIEKLSSENMNHPWLSGRNTPVILSSGRLAKQENYKLVLQAFAVVKKKYPARLIILGEDPERTYLEFLTNELWIHKHVSMPGFAQSPYNYIANSDVFVLSSEEEGFGLVLVEAMVCGTPIMSTTNCLGGPKDVLKDGERGMLVPMNNPEVLAQTIVWILEDKHLRKRLVIAELRRARDFLPLNIARQYLVFIESLRKR